MITLKCFQLLFLQYHNSTSAICNIFYINPRTSTINHKHSQNLGQKQKKNGNHAIIQCLRLNLNLNHIILYIKKHVLLP